MGICITAMRRWLWRSRDSTSFAANLCTTLFAANLFTYLLWFAYVFSFAFWSILDGYDSCKNSIVVTFRRRVCLAALSRNFLRVLVDRSRSFWEDYITIDHAVNRSLCRAGVVTVRMFGVDYQFAVVNLVGESSRTVGCVGKSYIYEPLVVR